MNVKTIVVGSLDTNCYILEKDSNCLIIDPGAEDEKIIKNIDPSKKVVGIIITHGHEDHYGACEKIKNKYQTMIYDIHNMKEGNFLIENFSFDVIYTPGHKDDQITIYFLKEKKMFVGDFIFKGGIGRTDLAGANPNEMKESIKRILAYPKDITLYPGHYEKTTLGLEEENLIYYLNII